MEALKRLTDPVVALRDRVGGEVGAAQSELDRGLDELLTFMVTSRDKVSDLRSGSRSAAEVALACLSVTQQILIRETKNFEFDSAIDEFVIKFSGGRHTKALLKRIIREAQGVLQGLRTGGAAVVPAHLLDLVEELLLWFSRRKESLLRLQYYPRAVDEPRDAIFKVEVLSDCSRAGVQGMEVSLGAVVEGHAREALWAKVFVYHSGEILRPSEGWYLWIDETDTGTTISSAGDHPFAAIAPVTSRSQRAIFDDLRLFIPYSALGFSESSWGSRVEVTLYGGLFDEMGESIATFTRKESIRLPKSDLRERPIPSPQASGVWSCSPQGGDVLSEVRLSRSFAGEEDSEVLDTTFDLLLTGREGAALEAEARLITSDGDIVPSRYRPTQDRFGGLVVGRALVVEAPVARFRDLVIQIPISHLDLEPGLHELFVEIAVRDQHGEVLCGVTERTKVRV